MPASGGRILVTNIEIQKYKLRIDYEVTGVVAEAFSQTSLTVGYSENISTVPESIAAVVFATNILPIVWVYDAELCLPELDKHFYKSIPEFKRGFAEMYPQMDLKGEIKVDRLVDGSVMRSGRAGLFFSGGVDAATSLITMLDQNQKPSLITVWGADIELDDKAGWKARAAHTKNIADAFGLDYLFVRSDFRKFINEDVLSKKSLAVIGDDWWHGLQHGIGLIGHAAPYAYSHGIKKIYIASSYTRGEIYTCASDPTIDNYVRFGSTRTIHDGYELSRQDKIRKISSFVEEHDIEFPLIVCWQTKGGGNCGKCEKCMRTAAGFIAEGQLPDRFSIKGFDARYLRRFLRISWVAPIVVPGWKSIQGAIHEDNTLFTQSRYNILWLKDLDLDHINSSVSKRLRRVLSKAYRMTIGNYLNQLVQRFDKDARA